MGFPEGNFEMAALGNGQRLLHGTSDIAKALGHFLRRFDVKIGSGKRKAFRIAERFAGLDAEQDVMRRGILGFEVMTIVGRHQRDAEVAAEPHQRLVKGGLTVEVMALDFEEVVVAELLLVPACGLTRPLFLAVGQGAQDFAGQAATQDDQPLMMFRQQLFIDARTIIKAFEVPSTDEFDQITIALIIFRDGGEMVGGVADALGGAAIEPTAGSDVELASQDRFDTGGAPLAIEFQRAEHIAMIGETDRRHAVRFGGREQLCYAIGTVEQGILRMQMQVHEIFMCRHGRCGSLEYDDDDLNNFATDRDYPSPQPLPQSRERATPENSADAA